MTVGPQIYKTGFNSNPSNNWGFTFVLVVIDSFSKIGSTVRLKNENALDGSPGK